MNKRSLLFVASMLSCLCSCNGRYSHYKALMLITTKTSNEFKLSFSEFDGQYVATLKKKNAGETDVQYTCSIGEGLVEVFYAISGGFNNNEERRVTIISNGEKSEGTFGYLEKGYKVDIIIKSEGKVKDGSFEFSLTNK